MPFSPVGNALDSRIHEQSIAQFAEVISQGKRKSPEANASRQARAEKISSKILETRFQGYKIKEKSLDFPENQGAVFRWLTFSRFDLEQM